MTVVRSSDKHGPVVDDVMKQEIEDLLRANRPTRASRGTIRSRWRPTTRPTRTN
jgi:hypothetical protein